MYYIYYIYDICYIYIYTFSISGNSCTACKAAYLG